MPCSNYFQNFKKRLPYKAYIDDDIQKAISKVMANDMSINKAADAFGIKRTTSTDKLAGQIPVISTQGPKPILTAQEQSEIGTWAINMSITKTHIFKYIENFITKN